MIDEEQLAARSKHIGSSDAAAILGLDPWRTPYDVWAEKTGRLVDRERPRSTSAMNLGIALEPRILDWAESEIGQPIKRDLTVTHSSGVLSANLDGLCLDSEPAEIVEAKTSGLVSPLRHDLWGDAGTDDAPEHIIAQVCHQQACVESSLQIKAGGLVAALLGGRGFVLYKLPYNQGFVSILVERLEQFWADNVQGDTPPTSDDPSWDTLKRLRRNPEGCVNVDWSLVDALDMAKKAEKAAKANRKDKERQLIAQLGDSEHGRAPRGGNEYAWQVTYTQTHKRSYHVQDSTYRVARIKKVPA